LAIGPPVLLLDDPFSDLGVAEVEAVCRAVRSAADDAESPSTILIASPAPPDLSGARHVELHPHDPRSVRRSIQARSASK